MDQLLSSLLFITLFVSLYALDNGKSITPPLGWRSWNLFGDHVNQTLMESIMTGMTKRTRKTWNGKIMSLIDLGYSDVGLDDAWQLCGIYGNKRYTYHDENGRPVVNTEVFPDFKSMTNYAHSLNLTAGWYHNNCICRDHCISDECYEADVAALLSYGFDSVKLDACGKQLNLEKWSSTITAAGGNILIENCHWGRTIPERSASTGELICPYNYYRSSGDIRASYESVISNLMTTVPLAQSNLSVPTCWAYPDMLEVGCDHGPGGENDPGLSFVEARTHFGAWAIVSSPLILSHDVNNNTVTDQIWPIISNTELISVNQAYAGDSGTLFLSSTKTIILRTAQNAETGPASTTVLETAVGSWQQWSKKLSGDSAALFVVNNDNMQQTIKVIFADIPTFKSSSSANTFDVRDLYNHEDLGEKSDSFGITLDSHDSAFFVIKAVR